MRATITDEPEGRTRRTGIDPLLKAQGWEVVPFDPARPLGDCTRHALTEFPTAHGPADYARTRSRTEQ